MNVEIVMLGNTALLCHNPRMVDPDFDLNRRIKALTGKRKKTDEDNRSIQRLEWFGGIFTGHVGGRECVTQPTSKVRKALINAARITKQGKQVERALVMTQLDGALIYPGSEKAGDVDGELERLFGRPEFISRLPVVVGGKRVMRVRPQFMPWAMIIPAFFLEDAGLNFDDLQRIAELCGRAERIGDNRVNGHGSFLGHVRAVGKSTTPVTPTITGVRSYFDSLDTTEAA